MKRLRAWVALSALVFLVGADTPAVQPTRKWEGPWVQGLFGSVKATIYYGPWRCTQRWMNECRVKCSRTSAGLAAQPDALKGCMWLADIKFDGVGHVPLLGLEIRSGTRYAMTHCCCSGQPLTPKETAQRRREWSRARQDFRERWAKSMGKWPADELGDRKGLPWDGHHVHDIAHGGSPTAGENILPVPPEVHEVFDQQYPLCYSGRGGWLQVGPERPYTD